MLLRLANVIVKMFHVFFFMKFSLHKKQNLNNFIGLPPLVLTRSSSKSISQVLQLPLPFYNLIIN
ncbi:hypothetical protein SCLARK_001567 [Spiroplasma clarkii]|nr:hypothetical protein SCLARK_001567 [Spiroplasma clarkii]